MNLNRLKKKLKQIHKRFKPLLIEIAKIAIFKAIENIVDMFFN